MVSAGTGIPETILFGDADVGNLATAQTLDRPTELQMANRQQLWADTYKDILGYCVRANILAPNGRLQGTVEVDEFGREQVNIVGTDENGNPLSADIATQFPDILQQSERERVGAIVDAATLMGRTPSGTMTDRLMVELLLRALGVEDIDTHLEDLFPDGATALPTSPVVVAGDAGAQPGDANFTRRDQQGLPGPLAPGQLQGTQDQFAEALGEFREAVARIIRPVAAEG